MISAWIAAAAVATTPITLEEVKKESRQNTQALLAELDYQRQVEQVQLARSVVLPHVTLNGSAGGALYGPRKEFSTVPEFDATTGNVVGFTQRSVDVLANSSRASFELSATVSQLIYDGGRWWNQIAQAGALVEAQAGQAKEQVLASELEGVRRFYDLYHAQETIRLLEANVTRSEQQVERAQSLFRAGRVQGLDVYSAQVNLGNDRLALVQQRARIVDAQGDLAAWIARPGTTALVAQGPDLDQVGTPPTLQEALSFAREHRPLLEAVASNVRASELNVQVAGGDNFPLVSAQVTAGRQGPTANPFFTDPTKQNFVQGGVGVRWDIFNGFASSAQVQQANIERRRAELNLQQAQRELEAEVRTIVVLYEAQIAATDIARQNVTAAQKGLELAQARFEAGAGSTIEVRDAQVKLTSAELTLLKNRIDVEIARAALDRTLGRGVAQ